MSIGKACHERHHSLLYLCEMEEDLPYIQGMVDGQYKRQGPYRAPPLIESTDEEVLQIDASSKTLVEITEPASSRSDPTVLRSLLTNVQSVIQRPIQPTKEQIVHPRQQRSHNNQAYSENKQICPHADGNGDAYLEG